MSYYGQQTNRDCEPTREPADQPKAPGDGKACEPLTQNTPPTLDPSKPCPEPPASCNCPPKPGANTNCLQILIDKKKADSTLR